MKRLWLFLLGTCALGGAVFTSGCGPGLVAAGGGSVGAIFGLQSGDDDDDDDGSDPPATNVVPAVVVTGLSREESPATISYTILDPNNDLCSVEVEYAVNGGSFSPCFEGAGGDGTTGLTSSAGGTPHAFSWEFAEDEGPQLTQDVDIRIRANDGTSDGSWFTLAGQSIGNDAPTLANIQAVGTDTVLFTFDFLDANSDAGSIDLSYSVDQGQSFTPVASGEIVGNPPTNLQTSPGGSPNQFIWDSSIALSDFVGEVLIKFDPWDQPGGYTTETTGPAVIHGPHSVDNSINTPPELELQSSFDGSTFIGEVPIDFTIQDDESDGAVVVVEASLDGGNSWFNATLVNQFAQGVAGPFPTDPGPTFYSTTWDALADIGQVNPYVNSYSNVVLRVTPGDAVLGTATLTDPFTLTGNEEPEVHAVDALQDAGNIPVVINVEDSSADPVSIAIEYSTDGVNYTPLSPGDFVFGDPNDLDSSEVGEDTVLIWDSTIQFPSTNAASVTLRVTPTDHPPSATPTADLTGSRFASSPFPIINDPAGADPVSIDVFTTDAGGTPTPDPEVTVTSGGTVYLDREVNPGSATVTDTFWKILETGADYGTLVDVGGGSLSFATGSMTCADPISISEGDTFVIDDGLNGPETFEFDTDNTLSDPSHEPVNISTVADASGVADQVADAINANPFVRITASATSGGAIDLSHSIACELGNAVSNGGNASDITFTGSCLTSVSQMAGGTGTQDVRYEAPAVPPAGTDFVTILCQIDDPGYFTTVKRTYRLYWGEAPSSVSVSPSSESLLVNETKTFSATVMPSGAPQIVEWEVAGGTVNGTISESGVYTAPSSVPSTNPVTVRAFCVDSNVPAGTASVTIQPEPNSITVDPPASNPPDWDPPDLALGESITFTATVSPGTAPQDVNWRVRWNNQDWGTGNSSVGEVDSNGVYTAPDSLPSPDQVEIQAVSQVKSSVFGGYSVRLKAPPPTDFDVSPSSATVTAGGAGVQFTVENFDPSNANQAVTWERDPSVGTISGDGFYSPPGSTLTPQTVTITARSVPAQNVTATATVTVNPNVQSPPSSVTISPDEGITTSAGDEIQFSATVAPSSASQSVEWSFDSASFGSIDQSGKYTPGQTNTDVIVTLRCEATSDSSVFDTVDVCVTGDNHDWVEEPPQFLGRGDHTAVWDDSNDYLWIIGGNSELTDSDEQELDVYYIDFSGATPSIESFSRIGGGGKSPSNTVAACYDSDEQKIVAILGQGTSNLVEVWTLDAADLQSGWQSVNYSATGSRVPDLPEDHKYNCWYDFNAQRVRILKDTSVIYQLQANGGSYEWDSQIYIGNTGNGPQTVELTAMAVDDTASSFVHYFVGASDSSTGASTEVYSFNASNFKWSKRSNIGQPPVSGVRDPSVYFDSGTIWVFGGRNANMIEYNSALYSIDIAAGPADWTSHSLPSTSHTPLGRGDAFFGMAGANGPYLMGGNVFDGTFGDFWEFDEVSTEFQPFNFENLRPQGRHAASGAMRAGIGYVYGGVSDHGVSNELWRMTFDSGTNETSWLKIDTTGERPPPLRDASMIYDDQSDTLLLFGGSTSITNLAGYEDEVYSFDTATDTWTRVTPAGGAPSARWGHAACYDSVNEAMWVFGGETASGMVSDLHMLDLSSGLANSSWSSITGVGGNVPDPRRNATLGYDSRQNRLRMIGGYTSVSGANSQLYEYNIGTQEWEALSIADTGAEEAMTRSSAVWDDACSRFIHMPSNTKAAQAVVHTSNGPTWQYLNPASAFNHSHGGTGLYDPVDQRYYAVFGRRSVDGRSVGLNEFKKVDFN